jgi:hypothetical protein
MVYQTNTYCLLSRRNLNIVISNDDIINLSCFTFSACDRNSANQIIRRASSLADLERFAGLVVTHDCFKEVKKGRMSLYASVFGRVLELSIQQGACVVLVWQEL